MLSTFFCRAFQCCFAVGARFLPWRTPEVFSGEGSLLRAADILRENGLRRPFVIASRRQCADEHFRALQEKLDEQDILLSIFSSVEPNPSVETVEKIAAQYKIDSCDCFLVIGGGSPMDAAKAAAARLARPDRPLSQLAGLLKVRRRVPPLIAVPTTAGTGSEVTLAAVITDDETRYKYPINDFVLIPRFAVHDPEFTRGLPASITGQTGMDALTHAVEAFIGRSTTPYTRKMARQAVQLIHDNLLEAYEYGDDIRARRNMLSAAYKAGVAFTRSYVGYVHAIAHSLGGRYGIPHGLANAIILPHMLRVYGDAAAPMLADLARMAGIAPANAQDSLAAEAFIDWVDRMNVALGIPKYVTGIRRSDIPEMAAHADAEANPLYPVPLLMDRLELERMYEVVAGGMFEDEN